MAEKWIMMERRSMKGEIAMVEERSMMGEIAMVEERVMVGTVEHDADERPWGLNNDGGL